MKIKLLFCAMLGLLLSGSAFSQWTALSSGTSSDLSSVSFANEQTGWIAGKSGLLRHTTDGGATWTSQVSGTSKDIYSVHFISTTTGWIAGKDGIIRTTTNGGATWTLQSSGASAKINSIHFINATNGIAVGEDGIILTTSDGGTNWIIRAGNAGGSGSSSDEGSDLHDVQMINPQVAYACGKDGIFVKTINGGVNWVTQNSTVTEDLEALHFPSETRGYVCYELGKVKQTNGTGTFTSVYSATSKDLKDLWFINEHRGWVIGDEGRILLTDNSGASWSSHNVNTTEELTAIHFPSAFTGYIVGKKGLLYKLTNADKAGLADLNDVSSAVSIFPNPAQNELTISFSENIFNGENVTIKLIDQQGKTILFTESQSIQHISLDLNPIEKGLYTLQLVSNQKIAIQKIIKL